MDVDNSATLAVNDNVAIKRKKNKLPNRRMEIHN